MRLQIVAFAFAALAACATPRAYRGNLIVGRSTFDIEDGRVYNAILDVSLSPDGCAHGFVRDRAPFEICPGKPEGNVERWTGPQASLGVEVRDGGRSVSCDGYLPYGEVHVVVPLGAGPVNDEFRKHPILLATLLATSGVITLKGVPSPR